MLWYENAQSEMIHPPKWLIISLIKLILSPSLRQGGNFCCILFVQFEDDVQYPDKITVVYKQIQNVANFQIFLFVSFFFDLLMELTFHLSILEKIL